MKTHSFLQGELKHSILQGKSIHRLLQGQLKKIILQWKSEHPLFFREKYLQIRDYGCILDNTLGFYYYIT